MDNFGSVMKTGTIIYIILWIIVSLIISYYATKDENDSQKKKDYIIMTFIFTFMGAFCMWLMWICVYMHQMYPLQLPKIKVSSL